LKPGSARRALSAAFLAAVVLVAGGCGFSRDSRTSVTVEFSGDLMLHIATVPGVLADGTAPTRQREELLKALAESVGGYVCIEGAIGDWRRLADGKLSDEPADLLLVQGPPQLGPFLKARLRSEFGQTNPVVVSIPAQSVRWVPISARRSRRARAGDAAPGG